MASVGRRPGQTQTREQILEAARAQFADRGYERTTLRSIARAAGVHPSMLHYHFGSKQQLYGDALNLPVDPWEVMTRLLTQIPRQQFPAAFVRHAVSTWRDPADGARLRAMLRRALSDPGGATMMRTHFDSVVIPQMAHELEVPETNIAALVSHLLGLTIADTMLGITRLHEMNEDDLVALVAPVITRYLIPESG